MEDVTSSGSSTNPRNPISIFNVVAVIMSAFFSIESSKIISALSTLIKNVTKAPENPKIIDLKQRIRELKKEMEGISQTSQFAAYFKRDRQLNKMNDELIELEASNSTETTKNLKIDAVVRVGMQLFALVLLRYVSSITAFCIPDTIFWPFNFLVRFPAIFGNDTCPNEFAEVSGFAVAFLMMHLISLLSKYTRKEKTD